MALICPACGTENRAVAKFCIECIGALQPDFEPTRVVPLRPSSDRSTTPSGMPSALAAFASSAPASTPASASARAPAPVASSAVKRPDRPEPRKGLWLSLAAFALTLVIGAGGWVVAGAGGWYIYSSSSAADDAAHAVAPVAAAPASVAAIAPLAAAPVTAVAIAPAAVAPAAMPGPTAPRSKPRVAAASDPVTACASLGFIARSQCMAAQCAKATYRAQPACRAVIAQQQLMEQKRNPTLAN